MTDDKRIAALEAELTKLKSSQPTVIDPGAVAKAIDAAHQMREQNASHGALSHYTPSQLREMRAACPDPQVLVRDHRGAPLGPSSAGTSGQVTKTSSNVGLVGTTGWQTPRPIKNGLGQGR